MSVDPNDLMFSWNPQENIAGTIVLPKGSYIFKILEPKPYVGTEKDPNTGEERTKNFGTIQTLEVVSGNDAFVGKKITIRNWLHSSGAQDMTKGFYCAAYGFDVRQVGEQDKFNEASKSMDWSFGKTSLGEAFLGVTGKTIGADIPEPKKNKETGELQNNFNWRPVK